MRFEGTQMFGGPVAHVSAEAVDRERLVCREHERVARNFRQDGCGGDRERPRVALDQLGLLGFDGQASGVDEDVVDAGVCS